MTTLSVETCAHLEEKTWQQWCYYCGDFVVEGTHRLDGSFDETSVVVTAKEIVAALNGYGSHSKTRNTANARIARWNIAFGKHLGTYGA